MSADGAIEERGREIRRLESELADLDAAYDASPVGMCIVDPDLRYVRINQALAVMNGQPAEAHIGRRMRDMIPTIAEAAEAVIRGVLDTGEDIVDLEVQGLPLDDPVQRRVCLCGFRALRGRGGSIVGVAVTAADITETRRAEEALRESETRFREMAENVRDVFWLFDLVNQRVIYASPAYEAIWGRPVAALYARREEWSESIHPEDREASERSFDDICRGVEGKVREYRVVRPDGSVRWVADRGYVIRDDAGEIVRIAGIAEDITLRRAAEEALHRAEARLRGVTRHAPVVLWAVDAEGHFTLSEGRGLLSLGLEPGQVVGGSIYEIYADHPEILEPLARALRGEEVAAEVQLGDVVFTSRFVPSRDAAGKVVGVFGVALEITEQKRAELERSQLEAQIQQTQRLESLGVLAGGIAHDFNNLLMSVLGNADLGLRSLPPDSPGRAYLRRIETAAVRAAELTNQMLAYSGKGRFVIEPVSLNRIVEEMGGLLGTVISKKAELRFDLAPDLPTVEADASQLRQVVMNLITNASEALGERTGEISVSTEVVALDGLRPGDRVGECEFLAPRLVALQVTDDGCGMDAETRDRIFDPFYTTKFTGRGLGLAAVLGIVQGHHGCIEVRSEKGRGTTFRILLPPSLQPEADRPDPEDVPAVISAGRTILVVDDDPAIRQIAKEMLEMRGFLVRTAADGREGVEMLERHRQEVELVILDMTMPRMNGDEALRAMRTIRPDLKVLLTSGYDEQDATGRFGADRPDAFLQKPYRAVRLLLKVHDVLST